MGKGEHKLAKKKVMFSIVDNLTPELFFIYCFLSFKSDEFIYKRPNVTGAVLEVPLLLL